MIEYKNHADKIILDTYVFLEDFLNSKKTEEVETLLDKIMKISQETKYEI
jgi:hypothetical protein